jgi:hypothetical protein
VPRQTVEVPAPEGLLQPFFGQPIERLHDARIAPGIRAQAFAIRRTFAASAALRPGGDERQPRFALATTNLPGFDG